MVEAAHLLTFVTSEPFSRHLHAHILFSGVVILQVTFIVNLTQMTSKSVSLGCHIYTPSPSCYAGIVAQGAPGNTPQIYLVTPL